MHFLAKKTGASLSREPQETRQGNLPAPAAPWHPGHSVAMHRGQEYPQARGGQGQLPASLPLVMSPAWPGLFSRARMLGAAARSNPRRAGCLCRRGCSPLLGRGASRKAPFPLCPAGFTLRRAGTMRGSRLRGERGQAPGQRGPRREISHSRSDGEGSESSEGPGRLQRLCRPTVLQSPLLLPPASESHQEGTASQGQAGSIPVGLSPSLRSGQWGVRVGGLCASLALRARPPQRAGEWQQGFRRAGNAPQSRPGWEGRDKTRAAGWHRPRRGYRMASGDESPCPTAHPDPGSCPAERAAPANSTALAARSSWRGLPRRLPLPTLPALPPRCQGARSHSALAMAVGAGGRLLAPAPGSPCFEKRPRREVSFLRLRPAPARGGGGERKRPGTGCLSQRHNPLSRPRPLFLPCHRPGGGMAEGPWVCAAHPPSTHPDSGSPRGPAKAADRGGGARPFLRAFLLQCPERGQGPGGHGRHRLGCPPRG